MSIGTGLVVGRLGNHILTESGVSELAGELQWITGPLEQIFMSGNTELSTALGKNFSDAQLNERGPLVSARYSPCKLRKHLILRCINRLPTLCVAVGKLLTAELLEDDTFHILVINPCMSCEVSTNYVSWSYIICLSPAFMQLSIHMPVSVCCSPSYDCFQ